MPLGFPTRQGTPPHAPPQPEEYVVGSRAATPPSNCGNRIGWLEPGNAICVSVAPAPTTGQKEGHGREGHGREGHGKEGHGKEGHGKEGHGKEATSFEQRLFQCLSTIELKLDTIAEQVRPHDVHSQRLMLTTASSFSAFGRDTALTGHTRDTTRDTTRETWVRDPDVSFSTKVSEMIPGDMPKKSRVTLPPLSTGSADPSIALQPAAAEQASQLPGEVCEFGAKDEAPESLGAARDAGGDAGDQAQPEVAVPREREGSRRLSEQRWLSSENSTGDSLAVAGHNRAYRWAKKMGIQADEEIELLEEKKLPHLWGFVHGTRFQFLVSTVIVLNALFIGFDASCNLHKEVYGDTFPEWLTLVEWCFVCFFAGELLVRLMCERRLFFYGREWRWNAFDTILVSLSFIDLVLNSVDGQSAMVGATIGRILRLARFFRLMRITRVIRNTYSLRLVVFTILDSMGSLCWCFLVIGFIIYIFAVLIVHGAAEHFKVRPTDDAAAKEVLLWFGGIFPTMNSLFMAITGGADWSSILKPLEGMHVLYAPFFVGYIFFMYFGVLNVVIGAFVSTTADFAAKDREHIVKFELDRMRSYIRKIRTFFKEADCDDSGTLSWEEFKAHLKNKKVKAYFQALELDVSQAHVLFNLLDSDNSNSVTLDEFLEGCLRLKGSARSIDINMLLYSAKQNFSEIKDFITQTQRDIAELRTTAAAAAATATSGRRSPVLVHRHHDRHDRHREHKASHSHVDHQGRNLGFVEPATPVGIGGLVPAPQPEAAQEIADVADVQEGQDAQEHEDVENMSSDTWFEPSTVESV